MENKISKANTSIVKMYSQLDLQDSQLKMIACEIGFNLSKEEAIKSKQLLKSLIKSKYESNLKLIDSILKEDNLL